MSYIKFNENLVWELRNWGACAIQYKNLPETFGIAELFTPFIINICDTALRDSHSFEYKFLSRIDSLLFGKFALRKYYVDCNFFPPINELCVDSYYDGLLLSVSSDERTEMLNKYNEVFSDIMSTDTHWIDISDELMDEFE